MNKDIYVEKRDGSKELFDIIKIKKSIEFAVTDTEACQLELESKFDQFIKNHIKTSEIQNNIIQHAVRLATPQNPEWLIVAGRAYAMDLWSNFKLFNKSFLEIVKYNIKKGEYTADLLKYYSDDDINYLGTNINHNRDLEHSYSSLVTVVNKYLGKFELNQHMHMVNAMRFGQHEPDESRIEFVKDLYNILSMRKLSLATPFMSNIRKGGNVASCFIISIEDELGSIFDNVKRIAKISKNGGGLGIFLGYIRAKGSSVSGFSNASGSVTQWVKIINDTLVAVNQSFTPETEIITHKGIKQIKDIKIDDKVLTHDNTYQSVISVKVRENDSPIHKITTEKSIVNVTEGHPVLVIKKNNNSKEELTLMIKEGKIKPFWLSANELSKEYLIIYNK